MDLFNNPAFPTACVCNTAGDHAMQKHGAENMMLSFIFKLCTCRQKYFVGRVEVGSYSSASTDDYVRQAGIARL